MVNLPILSFISQDEARKILGIIKKECFKHKISIDAESYHSALYFLDCKNPAPKITFIKLFFTRNKIFDIEAIKFQYIKRQEAKMDTDKIYEHLATVDRIASQIVSNLYYTVGYYGHYGYKDFLNCDNGAWDRILKLSQVSYRRVCLIDSFDICHVERTKNEMNQIILNEMETDFDFYHLCKKLIDKNKKPLREHNASNVLQLPVR